MAEFQFRQTLTRLGIMPVQILGILTRKTAKLSAQGRIALRGCVSGEKELTEELHFWRRGGWITVNARLIMSQQHALANQANSVMGKIRSSMASRLGELIVPWKVLGKAVLGIPCPGLGSPVQKSHDETGKGLVKSVRIVTRLSNVMSKFIWQGVEVAAWEI